MIVGIGTDLVQTDRIRRIWERSGKQFMVRVLTPVERDICLSKNDPASYLAKRYAVKEAASKALGTGIGKVSFQDMEVSNNEAGAPVLTFAGAAQELLTRLGGSRALVSISDERDHVIAFVVLE